jgi:hypothetical protein
MRLIMNSGQTHSVYGKIVHGDEEFEVPDKEGVTWIKMGRARKADAPLRKGRYSRSDMRVEDE